MPAAPSVPSFAGDLVTLFIFWEGIAIASVFLIWASRNERAYRAGMRYIIIHIGSGVLLLAGVLLHYRSTGLASPSTTSAWCRRARC